MQAFTCDEAVALLSNQLHEEKEARKREVARFQLLMDESKAYSTLLIKRFTEYDQELKANKKAMEVQDLVIRELVAQVNREQEKNRLQETHLENVKQVYEQRIQTLKDAEPKNLGIHAGLARAINVVNSGTFDCVNSVSLMFRKDGTSRVFFFTQNLIGAGENCPEVKQVEVNITESMNT